MRRTKMATEENYLWKDTGDACVLAKPTGKILYDFTWDRVSDAKEALDWIAQVSRKPWADAACVGSLVALMDKRLRFQETFCSGAIMWNAHKDKRV